MINYPYDVCPECGSNILAFDKYTNLIICVTCGWSEEIVVEETDEEIFDCEVDEGD